MGDTYGRIVSFIAAVIFMTLVPAMLVLQYTDKVATSHVDNAVKKFVDTCRETGCVSEDAYYTLLDSLSSTGYGYHTDIVCESKTAYPADSGTYLPAYIPEGNQEVMDGMTTHINVDSDGAFLLRQGDYISVTVQSIEETTSSIMSRFLTLGIMNGKHITSTDGGRVGATYQ